MKTPLNAIIQECLSEYLDPLQNSRYLIPSLNSCKILMNLIDDIQDSAQLEKNSLRIVNKPFSLPKLIEKTVGLFEIQASARQIVIEVTFDMLYEKVTSD